MTVTRGLAELKLLKARIEKETVAARFVDVFQNRRDLVLAQQITRELAEKNAHGAHDSIIALIDRRRKIKTAIMRSNAATEVTIGKEACTVAEAIERKNSIEFEQQLLTVMRSQYTSATDQIETQRVKLEDNIQEMLKQNLGADKQASKEDYDKIAKPFIEANELILHDPLGIQQKIEKLDKSIDEFLTEVDFVLSESNARTDIEI